LYPHLKDAHFQRKKQQAEKAQAATVSSFHSSLHQSPQTFILNSGSSAHMISDPQMFFTLELKELGAVQTSASSNTLKIEGIGSVKLKNKLGEFFLTSVLYIPKLVVNLLSVRYLKTTLSTSRKTHLK
jgi:hypothetical protein